MEKIKDKNSKLEKELKVCWAYAVCILQIVQGGKILRLQN